MSESNNSHDSPNEQAESALRAYTGAMKFDSEKPRMDLLDPTWLLGVSSVLTFGAKKYAAHNWRNGFQYSRLIAAAMRHLNAFNNGEDIDPESGLSHVYHASCMLMFLANMWETRKDLDDRYKKEASK